MEGLDDSILGGEADGFVCFLGRSPEMDLGGSRWDKILRRIREGLFAEEKR